MKRIFSLLTLLITTHTFAQTNAIGPTLSYQNQSGNFLKLGGYFMRVAPNSFGIKVDATANMAYMRDQFIVIPEAGVSIFPNADYLVAPYIESEITPFTITPKVGLSIVHMIDFNLGYGFDIDTKKNMKPIKGFTFSLGFSIPLNQILD